MMFLKNTPIVFEISTGLLQEAPVEMKEKDDNFVIFVDYFGSSMLQSIFFLCFLLVIFYTEIILRIKT